MADPVGNDSNLLLHRALAGDESALAALFDGYRERLRRMIRLRLDRRSPAGSMRPTSSRRPISTSASGSPSTRAIPRPCRSPSGSA